MLSNYLCVMVTHAVGEPTRSGVTAQASPATGALSSASIAQHACGVGACVLELQPSDVRAKEQPRLVVLGARRLDADGVATRAHRENLPSSLFF